MLPGTSGSFAQTVTTRVTFRRLAAGEIDAYVASGEGRDKAGAYAVQGRAGAFVERIDGSYTSVVGLPLCEVVVGMRGLPALCLVGSLAVACGKAAPKPTPAADPRRAQDG